MNIYLFSSFVICIFCSDAGGVGIIDVGGDGFCLLCLSVLLVFFPEMNVSFCFYYCDSLKRKTLLPFLRSFLRFVIKVWSEFKECVKVYCVA